MSVGGVGGNDDPVTAPDRKAILEIGALLHTYSGVAEVRTESQGLYGEWDMACAGSAWGEAVRQFLSSA